MSQVLGSPMSVLAPFSLHLISYTYWNIQMNIYSLKEEIQALEEIGYTMDTPERLRLELALLRLSELANSDQLLFWGKIATLSTPYYIAIAIDFKGYYAFPHKKFFYARDDLAFQQLPPLHPTHKLIVDHYNALPFTGNPSTVLHNVQSEEKKEPVPQDSDEEQSAQQVQPKNYTEEDRLGVTIRAIEMECQVVPVGAFRITTEHELRYNEAFMGVNNHSISSYQHFRYPQHLPAKLENAESIFRMDILDELADPAFWSVQCGSQFGTIRSLHWQGYVGYAWLGRRVFGGVYFGTGLKSTEVEFHV